MRSALLETPGVTRAQVSLERKEVVVTYDARVTAIESLLAAVNGAPHPAAGLSYTAEIKEPPRPAS